MCLPRWCFEQKHCGCGLNSGGETTDHKSSARYQERLKQLVADEFQMGMKKLGGSAKSKGDKADEAKQAAEAKLEEEVTRFLSRSSLPRHRTATHTTRTAHNTPVPSTPPLPHNLSRRPTLHNPCHPSPYPAPTHFCVHYLHPRQPRRIDHHTSGRCHRR